MTEKATRPRPRVLVLGAHPTGGHSMQRYSRLLERSWAEAGVTVRTFPSGRSAGGFTGSGWVAKWVGYVEKFVVAAPRVRMLARRVDAVHIADHSDALWALLLPRSSTLFITCHDLFAVRAAMGELPEHRPRPLGRLYQWLVRKGLGRANLVLCVSQATAADVTRISRRPIKVVHNPLDPDFAAPARISPPESTESYLLVVSSSGWRKRRETALLAWQRLRQTDTFRGARLHVVGPPLEDDELRLLPDRALCAQIEVEQNVAPDRLKALYSHAGAVLVLSRYEGFGWPVLEAQAVGAPVVVADIEPLREIAGPGAVTLEVETMSRLNAAQWQTLAHQLLSPELAAAAATNVRRFTIEHFIQALSGIAADQWGPTSSNIPTGTPIDEAGGVHAVRRQP